VQGASAPLVLAPFKIFGAHRLMIWQLPKILFELGGNGNTLKKNDGKIKKRTNLDC
jgi:hypothetical protein